MRHLSGHQGPALRRVLEITATMVLTCALALLLVIPGMGRKAQQQLPQLDPLLPHSVEGYLDPRTVPEAPAPDQPPAATPLAPPRGGITSTICASGASGAGTDRSCVRANCTSYPNRASGRFSTQHGLG